MCHSIVANDGRRQVFSQTVIPSEDAIMTTTTSTKWCRDCRDEWAAHWSEVYVQHMQTRGVTVLPSTAGAEARKKVVAWANKEIRRDQDDREREDREKAASNTPSVSEPTQASSYLPMGPPARPNIPSSIVSCAQSGSGYSQSAYYEPPTSSRGCNTSAIYSSSQSGYDTSSYSGQSGYDTFADGSSRADSESTVRGRYPSTTYASASDFESSAAASAAASDSTSGPQSHSRSRAAYNTEQYQLGRGFARDSYQPRRWEFTRQMEMETRDDHNVDTNPYGRRRRHSHSPPSESESPCHNSSKSKEPKRPKKK